MMLPLAGYRTSADPALLGPAGEVSAGAFFARVAELAAALPPATFVINLCENRAAFMLGFAAALLRGQTSLLPSGQGRGDWEQLQQQYPGAAILSDRWLDAPAAFDISPFMAFETAREIDAPAAHVSADLTAAILFTSGSTGKPTAHAKSWGRLVRGAAHLLAALAWPATARPALIGSVPPQHMFGLETTVMLPWYAGLPVHVGKPLLPADLESGLAQCSRPCWWMTTPVHLRAPLQVASSLENLAGIVASTMSLPPPLAAAAEAAWHVPVVEIYGSTETGALATRRTAEEAWWAPLDDVSLVAEGDGESARFRAHGSHIDVPILLGDLLELRVDGRFLWRGRSADLLKIAGKRASLAALNQWIAEIPGVDDATYFVPDAAGDAASHDDAHPARRLAAFYVSATLSPADVRAALSARVDPVFVPRPLYRVERLPRNANGKLPQAALTALFDAQRKYVATEPEPALQAPAALVVPASHAALPGHFPGSPIVPGVVLLDCVVLELQRQFPHAVLGVLRGMRFHRPLLPDQAFVVEAVQQGERVDFKVSERGADGTAGALLASGQWATAAPADTEAGA